MDNKKRKIELEENKTEGPSEEKTFGILRKFIERLGSDEVLDVVTDLAMKHDWIHDLIKEKIDSRKELRKVFVRSIPYDTSEEAFKNALGVFGDVEECLLIRDAETNKPKGFGFVVFKTYSDAMKAISAGRVDISDRTAYIHFAVYHFRDDEDRTLHREGYYNEGKEVQAVKRDNQVFVRGFGDSLVEDDLWKTFEKFGRIEQCFIPKDKASGKSKGYGFVKFFSIESATRALKEPNKDINGVLVKCDFSTPKRKSNANTPYEMQNMNYPPQRAVYERNYPERRSYGYSASPLHSNSLRPIENSVSPLDVGQMGSGASESPSHADLQMRLQQLQLAQAQLVQRMGYGAGNYADDEPPHIAQGHSSFSSYQKGGYYDPSEPSKAQGPQNLQDGGNYAYQGIGGAQPQNKRRYYASENSILSNGMNEVTF